MAFNRHAVFSCLQGCGNAFWHVVMEDRVAGVRSGLILAVLGLSSMSALLSAVWAYDLVRVEVVLVTFWLCVVFVGAWVVHKVNEFNDRFHMHMTRNNVMVMNKHSTVPLPRHECTLCEDGLGGGMDQSYVELNGCLHRFHARCYEKHQLDKPYGAAWDKFYKGQPLAATEDELRRLYKERCPVCREVVERFNLVKILKETPLSPPSSVQQMEEEEEEEGAGEETRVKMDGLGGVSWNQ